MHSILTVTAALTALSGMPALADAKADQARAEEIVAGRCFMCHGMEGESASPVFPRLAGQHAEYVARQLADFKSGKRKSETMKPQAEESDAGRDEGAGGIFRKKEGGREEAGEHGDSCGRTLYLRQGKFLLRVCRAAPPVMAPKGHGTPQLPRLAGQHPRYIEDQLKQFDKRERTNDNAVMHTVASKLTELEAHAVAEYIATLD